MKSRCQLAHAPSETRQGESFLAFSQLRVVAGNPCCSWLAATELESVPRLSRGLLSCVSLSVLFL